MRNVVFAVLIMFALAGVTIALDVEDYLPLAVGNTWINRDSTADGIDTTTSRIVGTTTMLDYFTYIFADSNSNGIDTSYTQLRPDGLYSVEDMGEFGGIIVMKNIPDPFNIDDEWIMFTIDTSWTEGLITYYQYVQTNGKAEAFEDVTVPAGFFSNCVRIAVTGEYSITMLMGGDTIMSTGGSTGKHTLWIAEDVGPVKSYDIVYEEADTTESCSELIAYDLTGIEEKCAGLPSDISLKISPNPFNSSCHIQVSGVGGWVSGVEIFDIDGHFVGTVNEPSAVWSPDKSIQSGVYLVRAKTLSGKSVTKRIVYLK